MNQEIKSILDKIENKKNELDAFRDKFINHCKAFALEEFDNRITSAISNNPEKVKELGSDGLAPIKKETEEAKANLNSFVDSIFYQDELWLYKQSELTPENCPFFSYNVNGNRLPDIVEEPVRLLMSPIGKILIEHELESKEYWKESEGLMIYRYGLSPSNAMKDSLNEFSEKFDELFRLLEEMKVQKRKKESGEALDLWGKS